AGIDTGLRINIKKTKTMIFGKKDIEQQIEVLNSRIENVKEFVYLGSVLTWDNDCSKDIRARINKAKGVMTGFGEIRSRNERKYKKVMVGSMDGKGKRGRPKREWLDDIREWCQKDIQTLSRLANERGVWKEMVNCALDTYGQYAQGV